MKVYVVMCNSTLGTEYIANIFSTLEKAEAFVAHEGNGEIIDYTLDFDYSVE